MKKYLPWVLMLLGLLPFGQPFPKSDIAALHPARILVAEFSEDGVVLKTDTEDAGAGDTLAAALEDMERSCDGELFLDTVEYLLVKGDYAPNMHSLESVLRPGCAVCTYEGMPDPEQAAKFLASKKLNSTLSTVRWGGLPLKKLICLEGRMYLE